jgi:hypothetical protein
MASTEAPGPKEMFDVDCSGGYAHILYASWDSLNSDNWSVQYERKNITSGVTTIWRTMESAISADEPMTWTHGCIKSKADETSISEVVICAMKTGPASRSLLADPPEESDADFMHPFNNRYEDAGVKYWQYNYITDFLSDNGVIHGHRVTTNPVWFEDGWYVGVQQWADYTPHVEDIAAVDGYVLCPPAQKPVTTVLCELKFNAASCRPVAYVDAGQGQHCDYTVSELMTHLATLVVENGTLLLANRVIQTVFDGSYYIGDNATSKWKRNGNTELAAEALCRVHRISPNVQGSEKIYTAKFGDGMVVGTALPLWFDGSVFAEFSPLDSPEIIQVRDEHLELDEEEHKFPTQGYEFIEDGGSEARKFVAVVGYYDARGNKHRSAPSSTLYVNKLLEGGSLIGSRFPGSHVKVYVTPSLTALGSEHEYFCEIYVSEKSDDDPQLAGHTVVPADGLMNKIEVELTLNRETPRGTSTVATQPRTSPAPYTSGGTLAADPWPGFSKSVVTSTRFWAIDDVSKGRVLVSKLFEDFISPEYNSTLTIRLGDERSLTAIGKLDDKVIVFEPNDVHVIYGEGPDNRGQGQDFAVHYVTTDVGCEDQESVIETPAGLIFYSKPRGFYLLDRNLQIQFIGGGIEDLTKDIDVVTATLVPDKAEVRFAYTGEPRGSEAKYGPSADTTAVTRPPRPIFTNAPVYRFDKDNALTFNYERQTWMKYTNYGAQAATIYQNKYTMLRSDWSIWQEKVDRWDDPIGFNLTTLRTPWIKLSEQVQSFERLWKMTFLGRYMSSLQDIGEPPFPLGSGPAYEAGDVEVKVYYDYESTSSQTKLFPFQDFGYDPFNSPPKRAERFQFEIEPSRGRCQAVKLEITEKLSTDRGEGLTYKQGHGFEIVSIDFDIGVSPMRSLLPQKSKK